MLLLVDLFEKADDDLSLILQGCVDILQKLCAIVFQLRPRFHAQRLKPKRGDTDDGDK